MNANEFVRGFENSVAAKRQGYSVQERRMLEIVGEHLKAAAEYRTESQHAGAIPQPVRPKLTPEFPKALGKYDRDGKVLAVYLAPSLETQAPETHSGGWYPLRGSLEEYERLKAAGVPEAQLKAAEGGGQTPWL
jgi:hypothetical protein